eukprot:TRINITY_DN5265_c0_g1_i1.p1 TRINITY_DN5265_c0_g1~~TRINITY_DN5265_c0_g1_i1.p1  ORF type:complete len:171 (-),score=20.55 TRINITY_DN5265_c0_g1_i1:183-650(-)
MEQPEASSKKKRRSGSSTGRKKKARIEEPKELEELEKQERPGKTNVNDFEYFDPSPMGDKTKQLEQFLKSCEPEIDANDGQTVVLPGNTVFTIKHIRKAVRGLTSNVNKSNIIMERMLQHYPTLEKLLGNLEQIYVQKFGKPIEGASLEAPKGKS